MPLTAASRGSPTGIRRPRVPGAAHPQTLLISRRSRSDQAAAVFRALLHPDKCRPRSSPVGGNSLQSFSPQSTSPQSISSTAARPGPALAVDPRHDSLGRSRQWEAGAARSGSMIGASYPPLRCRAALGRRRRAATAGPPGARHPLSIAAWPRRRAAPRGKAACSRPPAPRRTPSRRPALGRAFRGQARRHMS